MRLTYRVVSEPDDNGDWLVTVPDVPEAHIFGLALGHAREMERDAVALGLDVDSDSFVIVDDVRAAHRVGAIYAYDRAPSQMNTPRRANEMGLSTSAIAWRLRRPETNHHGSTNRSRSSTHLGAGVQAPVQRCSTSAASRA
jgi:hypothetical protein